MNTTELKELIQRAIYHPDFIADEVDHDKHQRLMQATLLQLYVVPDRRQGTQCFAQRGVPGVFQHV
jgi:hypothetical protein